MSFTKKTTGLCRRCEGETKLIVRGGRSVPLSALLEESDSEGPKTREFQTDLAYELVECCSCEYIDLRASTDLSGVSGFTVRFHPQLSARPVPAWRRDLPRIFSPLVDEVYAAINAESRILVLMGVRAVLDVVLDEKAGEVVSFKGRLAALGELGIVGERDLEFLWNVLIGDAAAPRIHAATLETVNRAMDVMEEILHTVYVRQNVKLHPDSARAGSPESGRRAYSRGNEAGIAPR